LYENIEREDESGKKVKHQFATVNAQFRLWQQYPMYATFLYWNLLSFFTA